MNNPLLCNNFESCSIRLDKSELYTCNGLGEIAHHSRDPAFGDIPVRCSDYVPEISIWRTDLMTPEFVERRQGKVKTIEVQL